MIGMGETIMDIIFRNGQPQAAVHGGSSFNSIVSVGRAGVPCVFVGDTGADIVGRQTLDFMRANHVGTDYCPMRPDVKSAGAWPIWTTTEMPRMYSTSRSPRLPRSGHCLR